MQAASIDIGTNSVLLLVADINDGNVDVLTEMQRMPRLGRGVDAGKNLQEGSWQRVVEVLKEYRHCLETRFPGTLNDVRITATSAVRDAANRDVFLRQIREETGWTVRILSGEEEAETTFRGAMGVLPAIPGKSLVLDIGGGSTEVAYGDGLELEKSVSLNMGSVRFSERFFSEIPPTREEIGKVKKEIKVLFSSLDIPPEQTNTKAVGVAGTVTSIAAIRLGLDRFLRERVNGTLLKKSDIREFIEEFSVNTASGIEEKYPNFLAGRGDIILAGMFILEGFLDRIGKDELIVSTGGIRYGILLAP